MSALFAHDVYIWWLVDLTTQKKQQHLELGAFLHGHFVGFPSKTCVVCYDLFFLQVSSLNIHPPREKKQVISNIKQLQLQRIPVACRSFGFIWSPNNCQVDRCEAVREDPHLAVLASVRSIHHLRIELHIFLGIIFGASPKKPLLKECEVWLAIKLAQ